MAQHVWTAGTHVRIAHGRSRAPVMHEACIVAGAPPPLSDGDACSNPEKAAAAPSSGRATMQAAFPPRDGHAVVSCSSAQLRAHPVGAGVSCHPNSTSTDLAAVASDAYLLHREHGCCRPRCGHHGRQRLIEQTQLQVMKQM